MGLNRFNLPEIKIDILKKRTMMSQIIKITSQIKQKGRGGRSKTNYPKYNNGRHKVVRILIAHWVPL